MRKRSKDSKEIIEFFYFYFYFYFFSKKGITHREVMVDKHDMIWKTLSWASKMFNQMPKTIPLHFKSTIKAIN
jgi:hypothetical protein